LGADVAQLVGELVSQLGVVAGGDEQFGQEGVPGSGGSGGGLVLPEVGLVAEGGDECGQRVELLLVAAFQDGQGQVGFGGEVGVHGAFGVAGAFGDLLDRGACQAAFGEHLDRGVQQLLSGAGLALGAGESGPSTGRHWVMVAAGLHLRTWMLSAFGC